MYLRSILLVVIAMLAGTLAGVLGAQSTTVYKHVDKDGKVTYSEKPPAKDAEKDETKTDGSTKKLGMDKDRNVIKPLASKSDRDKNNDTKKANNQIEQNARLQAELDAANKQLERARAALESGRDPREDEWRTVGVASGRPAQVLTEAYHERIKALEQGVKDAEAAVQAAENAVRRGVR